MSLFNNAKSIVINEKEVKSITTIDGDIIWKKEELFTDYLTLTALGEGFAFGSSPIFNGDTIIVDWGDGTTETLTTLDEKGHTYSDGLTEHTITLIGEVTGLLSNSFYRSRIGEIYIPSTIVNFGDGLFSGTYLQSIIFSENCQLTELPNGCFNGCLITSISIPNTIINLGYSCFSSCTNLTNITIPQNVTSIRESTFGGCTNLTNITIPQNVTSIGSNAFSSCINLTNITIPQNVTSIEGAAFSSCINLTSIIIPNSVTRIGTQVFRDCVGLASVTIPATIQEYTGLFRNCNNIIDYQLYWQSPPTNWVQISLPINGNTIFTIPYGTTESYIAKKYPSDKLVERPPDIQIQTSDLTKYYKGSERFTATITINDEEISFDRPSQNGNTIQDNIDNYLENNMIYYYINNTGVARGCPSNIPINQNAGEYEIQILAIYDGAYKLATNNITILPTIEAPRLFEKYLGDDDTLDITFLDSSGNIVQNTNMQYNLNGQFYDITTDSNGQISLDFNDMEAGNYIITFYNLINGEIIATELNLLNRFELIGNDINKFYHCNQQYYIHLYDRGELVTTEETINFTIYNNGNENDYISTYQQHNDDYYATLNIDLMPGEYNIIATYTYNEEEYTTSNNITILPIIIAEDLYMKYNDDSQFIATVINCNGIPIPDVEVTFNLNGILYRRTTDSNGQARLNIKLMSGEYSITSSYDDMSISNIIVINDV